MYCPACRADFPDDWKVCPKDATNLLRSAQIGKYAIEGLLGVGGMGAVYRAVNPDTRGRVAIKVMNPSVAGAESARQRFQREAAAVAALRTTHVVKVYDFGTEVDGTLYLVMELLDGHPLRDEIQPAPQLMDLARVQLVLDGALKGLAAAHKAGIVHRDLKPENVFVADTDDGEVPKLLDFGIARVRTKDSDLTRTGSLMGTAAYMAVEQIAAGSGEIGPWSDVYAMGAIAYEMLAGTPAYGGTTMTEVLSRVLRADCPPLRTARAGLPESVYALVERCMDPDPTRRPRDADAMRAALAAAQIVPPGTRVPPAAKPAPAGLQVGLLATEGHDSSVPVAVKAATAEPAATATPAPTSPPPVSARRRSPWPLVLAGVLIASAGGYGVMRALGGDAPPPASARDAAVVVVTADAASLPDDAAPTPPADAMVAEARDGGAPRDGGLTSSMVAIPAGEHAVGQDPTVHPDALPPMRFSHGGLWIDRTEVTLGTLRTALGDPKAGGVPGDALDLPARRVSWAQAAAACTALGKRLPSEQEWEIAARTTPGDAGSATLLTGKPTLVASTRTECSTDGLCDMLGSVYEWTTDDWPAKKGYKTVRGASYAVSPTAGWPATIHARAGASARTGDPEVGFRCVIAASPTSPTSSQGSSSP